MKKTLTIMTAFLAMTWYSYASDITLTSPNGKMKVTIHANNDRLTWEINHDGTTVLTPSEIGLNGALAKMKGKTAKDGSSAIVSGSRCRVEFHADNDAAAYRILLPGKKPVTIEQETAEFNFSGDYEAFVPYVNDNRSGERWCFSFESRYDEQPLSKMFVDSIAINPLAVRLPQGKLAVIFDANVIDYPGMFLKKNGAHGLQAEFAPYPLEEENNGHARLNLIPTQRANYIAKAKETPWRIVAVTENDAQLLNSDIARRYGPACRIEDTSWICPGKVAWDWWNATMLTGVDFRAGMNTDTYKYYIDFASKNHLEYIIIDEGWSGRESLTEDLNPAIDLKELVAYGRPRNVGIILWSSWRNMIGNDALDGTEAMERYMKHYSDMGIKGFKVDFFDRDDQQVVRSAWRMAECAARHHLLLDYHGLKPIGVHRVFPNVLNYEGVKGLENSKWEPRVGDGPEHDQPRYDVTIPYLRMLCGPLDYTPGAMDNATRDNFFGNNNHPMSQGTRCHQVAMYVVFHAPLQMLADSPTKYMREQETTDFIRQIPTTFDESVALCGELGEYVALARRKGSTWYVAAMTNWTPRTLVLDLSFLSPGSHQADIFCDGVNAQRSKEAMDYRHSQQTVSASDGLTVRLAPGGGWAAIIR